MSSPPQFGKYRLIAELGRGGMATVYLALTENAGSLDFSKLVVIKRLREHVAADPDFVVMLQDEARLTARLNHQNVVQMLEVGEYREELFLAMEFLDGQPLHRIRKRAGESFTTPMQLTVLADVLAGIHHAHDLKDFDGTPLNIVHRDVTPHNIFVTYDGQVKVLDFGIAKAEGRSSQTKHGVVKGKLAYMAPEQARGQMIDRRTDVFSTGVMLFEAVTGQRFWEMSSESDMLRRLIQGKNPLSPRERVPTVDEEIDRICRKALQPDPVDRYPTADDFAIDLEEYMRVHAPRVRARALGTWLAELFADRRETTRQVLEEQFEQIRSKKEPNNVPRLVLPSASADSEDIEFELDEDDGSMQATRLVTSSIVTASIPSDYREPVHELPAPDPDAALGRAAAKRAQVIRLTFLAGIAVAALMVIAVIASSVTHKTNRSPAGTEEAAPRSS